MSDDLKAKTVRGVGWSAVQSWGMSFISFLVYPILARILGPENYGLVAMAAVYISFLEIFLDVSFGAAIEQRQHLEAEHLDSIFILFLGVGLTLTAASILGAPLISRFFNEPQLIPIVQWLAVGYLLMMVSGVQTSLLRRDLRIKALASRSLVAALVGSSVGIGMALGGWGVWSLVVQRLLTQVVSVSLLWRLSPWRPRLRFSRRHFGEVAGFGMSVMGCRVIEYLRQRMDQLLIGRYFGARDLGLYFNASKVMTLAMGSLFGAYTQISMPALAKLQDDRPRLRAAINRIFRFLSLVAFPAFAGLAVLADELTVVVLGARWQESAPVLRVMALAGIAQCIAYVNSSAMVAIGRAKLRLTLMTVGSFVSLFGFLLAFRHGIVAVAAAYTICAVILTPIDILVNRRLGIVTIRGLLRAIWVPAVASVIMCVWLVLIPRFWPADAAVTPRLLVSLATAILIYFGTAVAIDRHLWRECAELVEIILPRRKRS